MNAAPVTINMLWIGKALGRKEQLSIASFLAAGHAVRLHSYDAIESVAAEVEVVDASLTVPFPAMARLRHRKTGSFALAANYFRYCLQREGAGLWSDLDVVCLKPIAVDGDCIFGLETKHSINNAILYLRSDLPITEALTQIFVDNVIPPWLPPNRTQIVRLKRWLGLRVTPAEMPWGSYGPRALTALARQYGVFKLAKPRDVFYPLSWGQAGMLYDPSFSLDSVLTERTCTVHLWNERLRRFGGAQPPEGSPLAKLYRRFGV